MTTKQRRTRPSAAATGSQGHLDVDYGTNKPSRTGAPRVRGDRRSAPATCSAGTSPKSQLRTGRLASTATTAPALEPRFTAERLLRLSGAAALVAAAVVHLAVMDEHYAVWPAASSFFLLLALAQAGCAFGLVQLGVRQAALVGLPINGGALLVWALSRTVGLPIGPHAGQAEAAERADVLAAGLEALAVLVLAVLLVPAFGRLLRRPLTQLAWWPAAALAVLTPAWLTPFALSAPSHHDTASPATTTAHSAGPHDGTGAAQTPADPELPQSAPGAMHDGTDTVGVDENAPTTVANLGVQDQHIDGRTMTVAAAEVNGSPGWVVVRTDDDGRPGKVVAAVRRLNGQHGEEVEVPFQQPVATGAFWVSLHRDLGQQRQLELAGPDALLESGGSPLLRRVTLTVQ